MNTLYAQPLNDDSIYVGWVNVHGHKPCPPKAVFNFILDQQRELSLQLFHILLSTNFSSIMDTLISKDSFINKIRDKFEILIQLM